MLERQCVENEKRESTLKQLQTDKSMMNALQGEERIDNLRQMRQMTTMQQEMMKQESLLRDAEQRRLYEEQRALEERLAAELERARAEKECDARLRQKVRAEAPELRDLERKLREAYANRERASQIAEREAHKFDDLIKEAELVKYMQDESSRARAAEKKREEDRLRLKEQYQNELEGQLMEQECKRQEAYEEVIPITLLFFLFFIEPFICLASHFSVPKYRSKKSKSYCTYPSDFWFVVFNLFHLLEDIFLSETIFLFCKLQRFTALQNSESS